MYTLNASDTIALLALVLAILTTAGAVLLSYVQAEKKKYAAERDFAHLKRNMEQLIQNIGFQTKALEEQFDQLQRDILEIKFYLGVRKGSDRPTRLPEISPWKSSPNNRD